MSQHQKKKKGHPKRVNVTCSVPAPARLPSPASTSVTSLPLRASRQLSELLPGTLTRCWLTQPTAPSPAISHCGVGDVTRKEFQVKGSCCKVITPRKCPVPPHFLKNIKMWVNLSIVPKVQSKHRAENRRMLLCRESA